MAIVGETNAGKSTLLNALLNEERAIVSDIHGTTRDVIEDTMNLGGITSASSILPVSAKRLIPSKLGIERSFQKLDQADIVLWVIDATCAEEQYHQLADKILPRCEGKHLVIVLNKVDLLSPADSSNKITETAEPTDARIAQLKAALPDLPEDASSNGSVESQPESDTDQISTSDETIDSGLAESSSENTDESAKSLYQDGKILIYTCDQLAEIGSGQTLTDASGLAVTDENGAEIT